MNWLFDVVFFPPRIRKYIGFTPQPVKVITRTILCLGDSEPNLHFLLARWCSLQVIHLLWILPCWITPKGSSEKTNPRFATARWLEKYKKYSPNIDPKQSGALFFMAQGKDNSRNTYCFIILMHEFLHYATFWSVNNTKHSLVPHSPSDAMHDFRVKYFLLRLNQDMAPLVRRNKTQTFLRVHINNSFLQRISGSP